MIWWNRWTDSQNASPSTVASGKAFLVRCSSEPLSTSPGGLDTGRVHPENPPKRFLGFCRLSATQMVKISMYSQVASKLGRLILYIRGFATAGVDYMSSRNPKSTDTPFACWSPISFISAILRRTTSSGASTSEPSSADSPNRARFSPRMIITPRKTSAKTESTDCRSLKGSKPVQ